MVHTCTILANEIKIIQVQIFFFKLKGRLAQTGIGKCAAHGEQSNPTGYKLNKIGTALRPHHGPV